MDAEHRSEEFSRARIGIIGFGAVGQAVLAQQVSEIDRLIKANPDGPLPLVEFKIYNEGNDAAFGAAYNLKKMAFALNFPAQCNPDKFMVPAGKDIAEIGKVGMHLLDGDTDHLVNWLQERKNNVHERTRIVSEQVVSEARADGMSDLQIAYHYPEAYRDFKLSCGNEEAFGPHSYLPRALYREYLLDTFQRTQEQIDDINARAGKEVIRLNCPVNCHVTRINCDGNNVLSIDYKQTSEASPDLVINGSGQVDCAIVATGHHYGPLFNEAVRAEQTFANTPLSDDDLEYALEGICDSSKTSVAIIGTGASYLDALRNLHALNYQGKVTAISSSPLAYWPFDPQKSGRALDINYFLSKTPGMNASAFKWFLEDELHSTYIRGAGPQNFFDALERNIVAVKTALGEEVYSEVEPFLNRLKSNRTSPESYNLYRDMVESGQLEFVAARMSDAQRNAETGKWQIKLQNGSVHECDALVDCAGLATRVVDRRGNISDPLIRCMVEETGVATVDTENGIAVCSNANKDQIAFAGVAGTNDRGLPFTRHFFEEAARPTLHRALELASNRNDGNGAKPALVNA